jgi:hypothetical protein
MAQRGCYLLGFIFNEKIRFLPEATYQKMLSGQKKNHPLKLLFEKYFL